MSKDTIFISYSRDDKEFVKNLAQRLRNAGADIWLDEFDIKIGENWDIAIQTALKESEKFLIVLSKTSVASNNVMDEVGFALSENKKVVPVLMEECDIPFRLQRRQFADLTGNDPKGVETLISALGLDSSVARKLIDEDQEPKPSKPDPKPDPKPEPKPKSDPKPKPEPKPKSKLPIYIGVVAVLVIAAVLVFAFKDKLFPNQDQLDWETTNIGNNIEIYEKYLNDHPDGEFVMAAKDSITKKSQRIWDKIDNDAWQEALSTNTEVGYELYRNNHKDGKYLDQVDGKIEAVKILAKDMAAWDNAKRTNSVRSYIDYILNDQLTSKTKMEDAIKNLKVAGKAGWLYSGRNNGNDLQFTIVKTVDGREIDSNTIPKTGDIVKANNSLRTYNSISGGQAVGSQGRSVMRNSLAYVNNATPVNTALFLEIVY